MSDGATLLEGKNSRSTKKRGLRAELGRQQSAALERLVSTKAAHKVLSGLAPSITFYEACGFWDITARSNANTLRVQLSNIETHLREALDTLRGSDQNELRLSKQEMLECLRLEESSRSASHNARGVQYRTRHYSPEKGRAPWVGNSGNHFIPSYLPEPRKQVWH